ncbi:Diaminopimelate epimerase-like protein, partial [Marasmius fiardii PR-910]
VLDVFTRVPFLGNPLAIVSIPEGLESESNIITADQKQNIAREFNLSETVFLHPNHSNNVFTIDIFEQASELPFAGHPTIGVGWHLLQVFPERESISLRTKAGDIPVHRDRQGRVRLRVPVDFKFHGAYCDPNIRASKQARPKDFAGIMEAPDPVASIVKGMSFLLVELTTEDAMARFRPSPQRFSVGKEFLGEWEGYTGLYLYVVLHDGRVRTRMFDGLVEDPATGSAASTLVVYLAKKKGEGVWKFSVVQGVEMGRRSDIDVSVKIGHDSAVEGVELAGEA